MAFWVGWQLWEKLSVVLGMLIAIVLVYGFCALAYNRWMIRRYTAAEVHQKEEETEFYPMLTRDDVPFGARALEQGIQVEGIWVCSHNAPIPSPILPERPSVELPLPKFPGSRPTSSTLSMGLDGATPSPTSSSQVAPHSEVDIVTANHYTYEKLGPGGAYTPVTTPSSRESPSTFKRRSDIFNANEKRASFHSRIWRASHVFDNKGIKTSSNDQQELDLSAAGRAPRPHSPVEQQRTSRVHKTLRRRSSEEFRRKMSQIFNERIHMNVSSEELQFNPSLREGQRRTLRRTILDTIRA